MTDELDMFDDGDVETKAEPEKGETEDKAEEETEDEVEESAEASKEELTDKSKEETPSSEPATVPVQALMDERRKRQEAESKLRKQDEVKEPIPDPVTNPDAYNKYMDSQSDEKVFKSRVTLSADLMKDAHEDYPEKEKVFMEMISKVADDGGIDVINPILYSQFRESSNPAKFAYQEASKHLDYLDKVSPDYEARLTKQLKAKLEANYKKGGDNSSLGLPDLTDTATTDSNTNRRVEKPSDRIDVFD
tara:strand:- start:541 stop:1284 length:744 start_codon:yes stop_codon:yes gene_type:complete